MSEPSMNPRSLPAAAFLTLAVGGSLVTAVEMAREKDLAAALLVFASQAPLVATWWAEERRTVMELSAMWLALLAAGIILSSVT